MFDVPPAIINFVSQNEYEVTFAIKKPYTRTSETVRANSAIAARRIIESRYGKDNVTIFSVKEIKNNLPL